jgi:predicted signal transduction protein with EAL and GGDEF domain
VETLSLFREGQRDARSHPQSHSELGQLGRSLNVLLDEFQTSGQELNSLALYDGITGLPNRQFFQERMAGALVKARIEGRVLGLLTLGMDGMKQVNETLGRDAGDELIRQIAERLRESVRMSDIVARAGQDELVTEISHLGGDEFTILLNRISETTDAAVAAQRILSTMIEPLVIEGHDLVIRTSIGIGVYPQDGSDGDTLLRSSTAAMNEAKSRGGNAYQFFSEGMNVANSRKLHIQSLLKGAIKRNNFELHFQPISDAKHGHVVAAEALLRWVDPEIGPVGPEEFIPIAEQCGLVSGIGEWVMRTACRQLRAWQDAGYEEIRIAVNVSAKQLCDLDWVDSIAETLRETGVSPGCLELELTETTIINDDSTTIETLSALSDMGVGIVLDDFGTGYSSLSHLRGLPINRVKIDRSFVSDVCEDKQSAALAGAIVVLAHSLQIKVVAEGVETHEQANFLREVGCDELQGYLMSRAVSASDFERFLTRAKPE